MSDPVSLNELFPTHAGKFVTKQQVGVDNSSMETVMQLQLRSKQPVATLSALPVLSYIG